MANVISVGMADLKVGESPDTIQTLLGSCVGVCLYSPEAKIGGMLHYMMADSKPFNGKEIKKEKFADTGIPLLIQSIKAKLKIPPTKLQAKIFGGAKILQEVSQDIGKDNIRQAQVILKDLGIPIVKEKTGGAKGYKISFDLNTGIVHCQIFGEKEEVF